MRTPTNPARKGSDPSILCDTLGIDRPVLLAPMAGVAGGRLAAAVSRSGGLGVVGAGYGDLGKLAHEMSEAGDAHVGIGLITWKIDQSILDAALAYGPPAVWLSFGDSAQYIPSIQAAGALAICQVTSATEAAEVLAAGADVVVAQGSESGGHGKSGRSLFGLLPSISMAHPQTPLVAAGGINTAADFRAAHELGAAGVALGTAFYATDEALDTEAAKQALVRSSGDQTVRGVVYDIVRGPEWPAEFDGRSLQTDLTEEWTGREDQLRSDPHEVREHYAKAAADSDMSIRVLWAGEGLDGVDAIRPASEITARFPTSSELQMTNPQSATPQGTTTEASIVVQCADLDANLAFFVDELGFRVQMITPADKPEVAVLAGSGMRLRLDATTQADPLHPLTLRIGSDQPAARVAPNGTLIEFFDADPPLNLPPLVEELVLDVHGSSSDWATGRVGMDYRDLIPSRLGGRVIASHIRIEEGGLLSDYPHFHKIRFQMIYCVKGWARLVYEDQGEPFLFSAGDCVLQPPEIRHRVLESSDGLEVVEVTTPAIHETFGDLDMHLPTSTHHPDREFGGQRFVHHIASNATWTPLATPQTGFESRSTGIEAATSGLATVDVVRRTGVTSDELDEQSGATLKQPPHGGEYLQTFILGGSATFDPFGADNVSHLVGVGDSLVIPSATSYEFRLCSDDFEFLRIRIH